jgi:hypothetical protein
MAITIAGARVAELGIRWDSSSGILKTTGKYDLMGSNGKVLAKQAFGGGYGDDVNFALSPETLKRIQDAVTSITTDINTSMGLDQGET